ncbi:hypothetical protein B0A52_08979 [Exophiala mesophila]|uniref:LicD/FKTN/FKRP nucleotidyltransferase domain-containing protein n=1 Tax=Exophiala mesophila TaxID=212818 RepID=A0A438MSX2_EXOME|nr:hypothetical protein B0A52_08979 [Exophiala mesophila]
MLLLDSRHWVLPIVVSLLALASCDPEPTQSLSPSLVASSSATAASEPTKPTKEPSKPNPDDKKYFHEPGGDDLLHHYDIRYFQKIVTDEERLDTLRHLIRAYLLTFEYIGVETWIAHGSLLAWYWNGKILPWDWDLDTQVTDEGLKTLGKHFNQTYYDYDQGDGSPPRRYFLDVNSMAWERVRGDGANIIDARFISVDNGLFIDITGLSEAHPDTEPGIIMCKNHHKYTLKDIFPLRETHFEGVKAKVPYSYIPILTKEYTEQALVRTEHHGHKWHADLREWIMTPEEKEKQEAEAKAKLDAEEKAKSGEGKTKDDNP